MISRWRSASARIRSDSAAPIARRSFATRLRSDCIRVKTPSCTFGSKSTRLSRTSMISTPMVLLSSLTLALTRSIRRSRWSEMTSATVSLATSFCRPSRRLRRIRSTAIRWLPCTDRMYARGSTMRHFTYESRRMLSFSAVTKRSMSGLSIVRIRLSWYSTFWNGTGSLKYRPGSSITSRISPSAYLTANWRWSTTKRHDWARSPAITSATMMESSRFMGRFRVGLSAERVAIAAAQGLAAGVGVVVGRGAARRRRRRGAGRLLPRRIRRDGGAGRAHQLVEREVQQAATLAAVHHDLRRVGEDLLHGLDVQALARDLRRLLVFLEHLQEARGVTLGARHRARAVALGLLLEPRRHTLRPRDHVVRIGDTLVDQALAVLGRLVGVRKGLLDLLGRLDLLDGDVHHRGAEAVAVQDRLHQREGVPGDEVLLLVEHAVDPRTADHLAHGRLPGLAHDLARLPAEVVVEEVVARRADPVLHRELHVDDALVARQHERLAQVLVARIATVADLDRAQLLRAHQLVHLDRERQPPGQAGAVDLLDHLAEAQHDRRV